MNEATLSIQPIATHFTDTDDVVIALSDTSLKEYRFILAVK